MPCSKSTDQRCRHSSRSSSLRFHGVGAMVTVVFQEPLPMRKGIALIVGVTGISGYNLANVLLADG